MSRLGRSPFVYVLGGSLAPACRPASGKRTRQATTDRPVSARHGVDEGRRDKSFVSSSQVDVPPEALLGCPLRIQPFVVESSRRPRDPQD